MSIDIFARRDLARAQDLRNRRIAPDSPETLREASAARTQAETNAWYARRPDAAL